MLAAVLYYSSQLKLAPLAAISGDEKMRVHRSPRCVVSFAAPPRPRPLLRKYGGFVGRTDGQKQLFIVIIAEN